MQVLICIIVTISYTLQNKGDFALYRYHQGTYFNVKEVHTVFQGLVANAASKTISRSSKNISCIKEERGADFQSAFSQYYTLRFVDLMMEKRKKNIRM